VNWADFTTFFWAFCVSSVPGILTILIYQKISSHFYFIYLEEKWVFSRLWPRKSTFSNLRFLCFPLFLACRSFKRKLKERTNVNTVSLSNKFFLIFFNVCTTQTMSISTQKRTFLSSFINLIFAICGHFMGISEFRSKNVNWSDLLLFSGHFVCLRYQVY